MRTLVLGPPGTGKTTHLIHEVEKLFLQDVPSHQIAYLAFTRKAASEAITRTLDKFNLERRELPYFRTIHSLCFSLLALSTGQTMRKEHYKEIGDMLGLRLTGFIGAEDGITIGATDDDKLLFLENLARIRCVPLEDIWHEYYFEDINWPELDRYKRTLEKFKKNKNLIDYTSTLKKFINEADTPDLHTLIIDEAQDLSELQWRVIDKISKKAKNVIFAGDDDQAIYKWAGASIDRFHSLKYDNKIILDQSYRIPLKVQIKAQQVSDKIDKRFEKPFSPRKAMGNVTYHLDYETIDMSKGSWLILARNKCFLKPGIDYCDNQDYFYQTAYNKAVTPEEVEAIDLWERTTPQQRGHQDIERTKLLKRFCKDIEISGPWYEAFNRISLGRRQRIRSMMGKGEDLHKPPRIILSTIHASKGGEAENVIIVPDLSLRTYKELERRPDDEHRVFYVAVTRARDSLHILEPRSRYSYEL